MGERHVSTALTRSDVIGTARALVADDGDELEMDRSAVT